LIRADVAKKETIDSAIIAWLPNPIRHRLDE